MSSNYQQHLLLADPELPSRWDGSGETHQCPCCSSWNPAAMLADVAGLLPAGEARWACDGCWSQWWRQQLPLALGDDFVTAEEWFCRFLELTGREAGDRDPFLGRQYALEADRLRGLLSGLDPASDAAVAAQVRLDKVIARSTLPAQWDKTEITADGIDAATLSGVPHRTEIECDGVIYLIEDGDFSLSTSTPGAFIVTARHPRYIWQTWVIHAN